MSITRKDLIPLIKEGLESLGLKRAKKIEEMFSAEENDGQRQRLYMVGQAAKSLELVVAGEFELRLDGVISDHETGTLCLIHICKEPSEIEGYVQEAAFVRNLLLENARGNDQSYFVELVLVATTPELIDTISDVLRRMMLRTSYLHAIGISVWGNQSGEGFTDETNVRRAFPWLLSATRRWYSEELGAENSNSDGIALQEFHMKNFRLPGKRKWKPDPKQTVHLIHGFNGSGKSSLTEAIELLVTGKIERLERNKDDDESYVKILKNRYVKDEAANGWPAWSGRTDSIEGWATQRSDFTSVGVG